VKGSASFLKKRSKKLLFTGGFGVDDAIGRGFYCSPAALYL
jgi:hypothetical protein